MANREETENWLKNLPASEKAEMMFKIKKEKKKQIAEIVPIFQSINLLGNKEIFSKSATELLNKIKKFLEVDAKYTFSKFSKDEFIFSKKTNSLDLNENSILIKYFPFLESKHKKTNKELIRSINNLLVQKKETIEKYHKKDIEIVHGFLKYTTYKLKSGEVFYFIPDYEGISWTKKEFVKNMSNYFHYKLKLNPDSLTENFINDMKGHYSFIGQGLENMEKTKLANDYFKTNKDAFNFGYNTIPSKYNDVADIIRLVPVMMMKNEKDLQEIVDYTIDEYNK